MDSSYNASSAGVLGPFIELWDWVKIQRPGSFFNKRRLNFITIHYIYILSLVIVGSILLYPAGHLAYIDALFFASGAATLSGLNTVDVNTITTYQQVVFYIMAMISNPIFVNTLVVFVRLYWFERRFQNIVAEAQSRTRSRSKTEAKDESNPDRLERGVDGRNIVVLHNGEKNQVESANNYNPDKTSNPESESPTSSSLSQSELAELRDQPGELLPHNTMSSHRDLTFADRVPSQESLQPQHDRLPQRLSPEQHIAFLENQRNPKDKGTLRIPGPREFDRGDVPERLVVENDEDLSANQITSPEDSKFLPSGVPVKRQVTIEEPGHRRVRADTGMSSKLTRRKTGNSDQAKFIMADDGGIPTARLRARTGSFTSLKTRGTKEDEPIPYLSWQPTIGRNSAFVDLTEDQREELGGIEYRSLKTLAVVLILYYVLFHLLGVIVFLPWIIRSTTWGPVVDRNGQSRVWWGVFTPASMFNDLGFTLTADSLISFQKAVLPLLLGSFFIVIGNTGFPCMLRFVIWAASVIVPRGSGVWEEFKFLLDHPRRCFTLLFPKTATWWLFWILVFLNGIDIIFFIILDLNDPVVTDIGSNGYRVLNGLFQAASTRTAGFSSVNLALLHPGIQVSYLIMMYISVFPIAISVRRTNVYEEKSLGIYGSPSDDAEDDKEPSYVGAHLRRQLSFDLWYIFMGLFIIAIAEGSHLQNTNEYAFTTFSCLFEIVSAYGTVGLSLGYPNTNASFSAQFSVVSKLVIIAMQIRGRHRGLPYELDRAILLPSESLHRKEDEDASKRSQRRNSNLSLDAAGGVLRRRLSSASWPAWEVTSPAGAPSNPVAQETENGLAGPLEQAPSGQTTHTFRTSRTMQTGHSGHTGHTGHGLHIREGLGKLMAEAASQPKFRPRDGQMVGD